MDVDGFRRAEQLFHDAVALPPAEREAFVHSASAGDDELARRVKRMIAFAGQGEHTGLLLDRGPMNGEHAGESEAEAAESALLINRVVGNYRIIEVLGEGGFGTVYKAEQQRPVQRLVALKMLRSGMDSRRVVARFDAERQALSVMEHPNIARVFDAGQTDPTLGSRPFFVMELVGGEPITDYCDRLRLDDRARLELLITVCHAVQHAHHKGIIHRDLKPSNILVSEIDGVAAPKVIDFGIAKAVLAPLIENPLVTQRLELLGTPQYMSPEQADPDATGEAGIDTRSDIYSLGVILFELLTGTTPLDGQTLRTAGPIRMQQLIRDQTVEKPSARLTRLGDSGRDIATKHSTDFSTHRRRLRGDLDWITLKALEHDRERRYSSAAALADDVQRHLRHEPVLAGPPTASYRIRKFVRRNRVAVLAASLIMLAVLAGVVGTTLAMLRARDAAAQAVSVNEFMRTVLTSVDPDRSGADVRLMDVMHAASESASTRFAGHPELEAQVRDMLSEVYTSLAMWPESVRESDRAEKLWQAAAGPNDVRTLRSALLQAQGLANQGHWRGAKRRLDALLPRAESSLGPEHDLTLDIVRAVGFAKVFLNEPAEGERMLRETYDHAVRIGAGNDVILATLNSLVKVMVFNANQRRISEPQRAELEARSAELVQRSTERFGPDSRSTFIARISYGRALWLRGDFAASAEVARRVLDVTNGRYNDCNVVRDNARLLLTDSMYRLGDAPQAADLVVVDLDCKRATAISIVLLSGMFEAMPVFEQAGRLVEGETIAREVLTILKDTGGGHAASVIAAESYLASFVSKQGRLDEADEMFASLMERHEDAEQEAWVAPRLDMHYAEHLARRRHFEEAESLALRAVASMRDIRDGIWTSVPDDMAAGLVAIYQAWAKPEKVAEYSRIRTEALRRPPIESMHE